MFWNHFHSICCLCQTYLCSQRDFDSHLVTLHRIISSGLTQIHSRTSSVHSQVSKESFDTKYSRGTPKYQVFSAHFLCKFDVFRDIRFDMHWISLDVLLTTYCLSSEQGRETTLRRHLVPKLLGKIALNFFFPLGQGSGHVSFIHNHGKHWVLLCLLYSWGVALKIVQISWGNRCFNADSLNHIDASLVNLSTHFKLSCLLRLLCDCLALRLRDWQTCG